MTAARSLNGWDCHAHLFGPYDRYPLAAERSYTPPEASGEQYQAVLRQLGLSHGVLVHPSAYGEDYARVFDALQTYPNLRGVIVARSGTDLALPTLRARGVRALRFSHRGGAAANFAGSADLQDLQALAPAMADAGLHAEIWTDCSVLPAIADVVRALPVPLVIDHMGGFHAAAGPADAGFQCLRALLAEGHVWVKLSAYRNLLGQDLSVGVPFQQALQAANPDQLVWGSDWPHLRIDPWPDTQALLQHFKTACGSVALQHKILVDNPARLYD